MVPLWVVAATVLTGAVEVGRPAGSGNVIGAYWVEGPRFGIPCKADALPPEVVAVELWYSTDNGRTWARAGDIPRDEQQFDFTAPQAGEYLFAPRLRYKNGRASPQDPADLIANVKVLVATGSDAGASGAGRLADRVDELDDELTRVEVELIAREIKRLSGAKELDAETEQKIDRLRARLREARERLAHDRATPSPAPLPPVPANPDDWRVPPLSPESELPRIPPVPTRPVAPPPRVPGPPS